MGRHFFVREDYDRADKCYQRCYSYTSTDAVTDVLLRQNHAETLARLGKLSLALYEVGEALRLGEKIPASRSMVYALGVKSWILIEQKKTQEAESTLLHAIDYAVTNDLPSAQSRMKLAALYLRQQHLQKAAENLQPVEASIRKRGDKHDRATYHELMSQLYEAQNNYQSSLTHFKRYHKIQGEIRTSEANSRVQAEHLIDKLENIRRKSTILKRENVALKDTVNRYKSLHQEARELSERDSLTGLYNRRMLESMADNIISLTANINTSVAVAVIDLDHFKRINDQFGHQTGDLVLQIFATLISSTFRSADCIARYGGEEFVLVMPQADEYNTREALSRLKDATSGYPWSELNPDLSVTFSAGIATTNQKSTFKSLFLSADKALYLAKAAGRDRICVADEVIDFSESNIVPDIDLANLDKAVS